MAELIVTVAVLALIAIGIAMRARARRAPAGAFEGEALGNAAGAPPPRRSGEPELPETGAPRPDA